MTFRRVIALVLRPILLILAVISIPVPGNTEPGAERRIALVIGISSYKNAPRLPNPVGDARAIGDALRRLKFDVTEVYDPGFLDLNNAVRSFGIQAASADVAVVYYAGHGVQVDRENYLIPADAKLERERDLLYEAMPLDRLLGEASQASHIGIVLLDSCRNNPFIERVSRSMTIVGRAMSTTPGMARVDNVPRNTIVVMAAKADQIAEDGVDHSPFAAALLAHLQIPGLELSLFFRSVRDTVLRATHNRQEPYVFSSLGADPFYFYPRPPNRPPEIGPVKALEVDDTAGPTPLAMPQPTDPDQDPLTIRIIGLPRVGSVLVDGKAVTRDSVFSPDQFAKATYRPDGTSIGSAGALTILIEDGRGGSVSASLPITVRAAHRPPVVEAAKRLQLTQQRLSITPPVSPDGDPLAITITALPTGVTRKGSVIVKLRDRLTPAELSALTFWPEAGFSGPAGSLRYSVDNGHGGVVEGVVDIEVSPSWAPAERPADDIVWERVRDKTDPAEFSAFASLFPQSEHAAEARRREQELRAKPPAAAGPAASAVTPPATAPAQASAEPPPAKGTSAPSSMMTAANVPVVPTMPRQQRGAANEAEQFKDCPQCPTMVRIPAGSFMMGQGAHDPESMPAHRVEIKAFALGKAPVTVAEWKLCMAANGCKFLPHMRVAEDLTPVHNLSWDDAGQYIAWLSTISGHPYRLPSEAEWEYAARGGTTTRYWWGDSVGMALANCSDCGGTQNAYGPLPVDAMPANPFGLLAMLGGVAQWTADCWFPNYRGAPTDATPRNAKSCEKRVLRGGSFRSPHDEITTTYRGNYDAPVRYLVNGFRVARDLE